jgi:iron(III) transport system permease protein
VTIGGKGHRSNPLRLGRWVWGAGGLIWTYIFCAVLMPITALILFSLMRYSSITFTWNLFTFDHYISLFTIGNTQEALKNTLFLGLLSGGVCLLMGFMISYMEIRRPSFASSTIAFLGVLPVAVPGVVYGIGLLWTYLHSPLYGTIWILLLAYIAKYLPYAIVVSRTSILQLNRELEESARMSGARPLMVLRSITMPILKPALVTIFVFVMLKSVMELSASVLLYSPRGPVLSVLTWSYMETGNFQFAAAIGVVQSLILVGLVILTRYIFRIRLESAIGRGK